MSHLARRSLVLWSCVLFAGALVAASLAIGLDALADGALGRVEAWLAVSAAVALTAGLALAALGAPVAGLLAGLLFLGSAAQLWLTEPDWFSTLGLIPRRALDLVMFAVVASEGAIAAGVLARRARGAPAVLSSFGPTRLVVLLGLTLFASVSVMKFVGTADVVGYVAHLVVTGIFAAIHLAGIVAFGSSLDVLGLHPGRRAARFLSDAAPYALAGMAVAISAALAWLSFVPFGAVEDETAYLFQAETFAAGRLTAPPLPPGATENLDFYLLRSTAEGWFAVTAPGWPAVLSVGVLLGAPWLVNPLLGGLAVLLGHRLVERCSDRWTANLVALLMATSPWLHGISASLMTHAVSLALTLGAWLLIVTARARWRAAAVRSAAVCAGAAGLCMGWLFLTRSLEGVLLGVLTGLWAVWAFRMRGWMLVGLYGLGCLTTGALLFPYNAHFTGDFQLTPQAEYIEQLWHSEANAFGFGERIGPPGGWGALDLWPGHSALEGLINTANGISSLNFEMFGWLTGSLVLVWAFLLWARPDRFTAVMAVVVVATIAAHFFYWFNGTFYVGPRYWYAIFLPLAVLSAAGAREIIRRLSKAEVEQAGTRVVAAIVLPCVVAVTVFTPWRGAAKYAARTEVARELARVASAPGMEDAILFVEGNRAFGGGMILNDPFLRPGRPILARNLGPEGNAGIVAAFPERRPVYLDLVAD